MEVLVSDQFDEEDIARLFKTLLGKEPDKGSTTMELINKAEDLYVKVAKMKELSPNEGGPGYATGLDGPGQELALYAGLEWSAIDSKLAAVCQGLWHNMEHLMERLQKSDDPEEIEVYVALRKDHDVHLVQNTAYHSFWLGYFTHELGEAEGLVTSVDESAVPVPDLNAEETARIAANATLQAMIDVDTISQQDDENDEDYQVRRETYRMPSLGITMPELLGFQHAATGAAMATLSNDPTMLAGSDENLNVFGMTVALGVMIGRALERRAHGQVSTDE
jgi:hypothetical protein